MNRLTLTLLALSLLAGVALGQSTGSREANYVKPVSEQYATSRCLEYQVKMLYQATDLTLLQSEQEKRLNAAEAYGKLWELNQPC